MKDFDHLLSVWQGQPKQVKLSVDDVLKQVKRGLGDLKAKLRWNIIVLVAVLLVIIGMVLFKPIYSPFTYVGLGIWIASMFVLVVRQLGDYRVLSTLDITSDPATYLSHMKLYKKRRAYLNGRFFYYYALAISIGVMLYANEFVHNSPAYFKAGFYALWLVYLAFVVFYLKKRLIARENQRVFEIVDRLENLKQQFE